MASEYSYRKRCRNCGKAIRMSQMADGHWVAFSGERAHKCRVDVPPKDPLQDYWRAARCVECQGPVERYLPDQALCVKCRTRDAVCANCGAHMERCRSVGADDLCVECLDRMAVPPGLLPPEARQAGLDESSLQEEGAPDVRQIDAWWTDLTFEPEDDDD